MEENTSNERATGLIVDEQADRSIAAKLVYVARLLWRDKAGLIGLVMFLAVVCAAAFSP